MIGGTAATVVVITALPIIGFGAGGVIGGSYAAAWMSSSKIIYYEKI